MSKKTFNCSCCRICGLEEVSAYPRVGGGADFEMIKVQTDHTDVRPTLSKGPVTRSLSVVFIGVSRVSTITNKSECSLYTIHLSLTTYCKYEQL